MNKQRPLLLIALMLYIFLPSITSWITNIDGSWYRPFVIWLAVIFIAFFVQAQSKRHDL